MQQVQQVDKRAQTRPQVLQALLQQWVATMKLVAYSLLALGYVLLVHDACPHMYPRHHTYMTYTYMYHTVAYIYACASYAHLARYIPHVIYISCGNSP